MSLARLFPSSSLPVSFFASQWFCFARFPFLTRGNSSFSSKSEGHVLLENIFTGLNEMLGYIIIISCFLLWCLLQCLFSLFIIIIAVVCSVWFGFPRKGLLYDLYVFRICVQALVLSLEVVLAFVATNSIKEFFCCCFFSPEPSFFSQAVYYNLYEHCTQLCNALWVGLISVK